MVLTRQEPIRPRFSRRIPATYYTSRPGVAAGILRHLVLDVVEEPIFWIDIARVLCQKPEVMVSASS